MVTRIKTVITFIAAFVALIFLSTALTALTIYILGNHTDIIYELAEARVHEELFARVFISWFLLSFFAAFLWIKAFRNRFPKERWFSILLKLFALGAAFSLADPFHMISDEYNWIRYWTAGVLVLAGCIAVWSSLSGSHRLLDRLFGGSFGLLLIAAGIDELLQFHEHMSGQIDAFLSTGSNLSGQDLVTLGFALFGAVAVIMAVVIFRLLPQARNIIQDRHYQRAFAFFALAVFIFLGAMMMDTFDWHMQQFVNWFLLTVFGSSVENEALRWYGEGYILYFVNSVEELMEYLAALLFLMTIGFLFAVKILGFDRSANN